MGSSSKARRLARVARSRDLAPLRAAVRTAAAEVAGLAARGALTDADRQKLAAQQRLLQEAYASQRRDKVSAALDSSKVPKEVPAEVLLAAAVRAGSVRSLRSALKAAEAQGTVTPARLGASRSVLAELERRAEQEIAVSAPRATVRNYEDSFEVMKAELLAEAQRKAEEETNNWIREQAVRVFVGTWRHSAGCDVVIAASADGFLEISNPAAATKRIAADRLLLGDYFGVTGHLVGRCLTWSNGSTWTREGDDSEALLTAQQKRARAVLAMAASGRGIPASQPLVAALKQAEKLKVPTSDLKAARAKLAEALHWENRSAQKARMRRRLQSSSSDDAATSPTCPSGKETTLRLEPEKVLNFGWAPSMCQETLRPLTVSNSSNRRVAFKVTTTNPRIYMIRPRCCGSLVPGETVALSVALRASWSTVDPSQKQRLIIKTVLVEEDEDVSRERWRQELLARPGVEERRIRVMFGEGKRTFGAFSPASKRRRIVDDVD